MARIVLVHGAFCTQRVWGDAFLDGLRAAGHTVETFDLPGHGTDATPDDKVTLQGYADRTVEQLKSSAEPAVLVGHSMGGLVITQAADDFIAAGGQIDQLIYIAAALPRDGKSQNDYTKLPEGAGEKIGAGIDVSGSPKLATLRPGTAAVALLGHCSAERAVELEATLQPQVIGVLFAPVHILDDRPIKRSYVLCRDDQAIPAPLQRLMASETRDVNVVEMESDHSPFISHTNELLEVFDDLIRG